MMATRWKAASVRWNANKVDTSSNGTNVLSAEQNLPVGNSVGWQTGFEIIPR